MGKHGVTGFKLKRPSVVMSSSRGIFGLGNQLKQWVNKEEEAVMSKGIKSSAIALPKLYSDACMKQEKDYYDYENSEVVFGFQDDYEFCSKLGRGRYSEVFKGVNLLNNESCVVKILKPGKIVCSLISFS